MGAYHRRTMNERTPRIAYVPGLDGLRALAVIAVICYHAGLEVRGGFLGVESFFALSGYLITALLLAEWRRDGRVHLTAFWARRALRLLPALVLLLAGVLLFAFWLLPGETGALPGDTLAALGYAMNWRLIASGQSYFDPMARPPLLQHLWSLAVEEQFYLLWPLLFLAGMRLLGARRLAMLLLAAAVGSAGLMALLYEPGTDPSRVYYGTDTRAGGLLLGAALALIWSPGRGQSAGRRAARLTDSAGLLALGGLLAGYLLLDDEHPLLYRGGFLLVAGLTAVTIIAATHAGARLVPALLGWQPLRWIGVRSYSLYLWHWPVFAVTRPYDDLPEGWYLLALRLALTVLLADLSYRSIERPARDGALRDAWHALRSLALVLAQRQTMAAVAADGSQGGAPRLGSQRRSRGRRLPWRPRRLHSGAAATPEGRAWGTMAPRRPATPGDRGRWRAHLTDSIRGVSRGERGSWLLSTAVRPRLANVCVISLLLISTATCASSVGIPVAPTPSAPQVSPAPPSATAAPPAASAPAVPPSPTAAPAAPTAALSTATPEPTAPPAPELPPFPAALAADLQRMLDETVADGTIPGASIAVHLPGYQPWTGVSGMAARGQGSPMTPETRLRAASISKMFTAVVVLQLAEEGTLDLETPLATWFPEIVPKADRITVRMLLQHTSGLYDYLEDQKFVSQAYAAPERSWAPQELVAYAARNRASFVPGAPGRWDYSSTNYVLLGMIVERVTGNTLASEMRRRIFDPLELSSTYFPPQEAVEGPQARGYSTTRDQTNVNMSFAFATANLVSTPKDLQRFGRALFGGELLQPATMEAMLQFVNGNGSYKMPELEYGLGAMRNRLPVGADLPPEASRVLGHIGGFGGFRSALWHAPASGITVALGVNQAATDPNILATKVFDAVLRAQGQ